MKKNYVTPCLDVVAFNDAEEIIVTSGFIGEDDLFDTLSIDVSID